jgi:hypothetical protein
MATAQTILFTVTPRGVSLNAANKPVSVFVSPRLDGANNLGAFPDLLHWTRHLRQDGLDLELQCGANTLVVPVSRTGLRPDLWEELFNAQTYVRSHTSLEDYSTRGMISFSVREALSALKSIYQQASVTLALPDEPRRSRNDDRLRNRQRLGQLVDGLHTTWEDYGFDEAAPRHALNDTRHHRVAYTATASSRYREYFVPDLDASAFTRTSDLVVVDVPASARPLAPDVVYVVPTFGWERQTETNLKRSVRFGGGLRVYLNRPWFSSGEGELLGVALWSGQNGPLDESTRDKFKPFFTQWGMDPIWQTDSLGSAPDVYNFPDADDAEYDVTLDEASARQPDGRPGRVSVAGFVPHYDEDRRLWFADLTINLPGDSYMPFVRLALVRYQPRALADAKVSRVVLADFAQLTPDRSAMVTADPHHPRTVRVVVSGVAPRGPAAVVQAQPMPESLSPRPTRIRIRVQEHDTVIDSDLAWSDVAAGVATVSAEKDGAVAGDPDLAIWAGTVQFAARPAAGRFRLLIEEHEFISAIYTEVAHGIVQQPSRLVYAEIFPLDEALVNE